MLKLRSDFHIERVTPDKVFIIDMALESETMSVTNDAENVTAYLYERYGNRRIIYRDTMECWDELLHSGGKFLGFKHYNGD